MLGRFESGERFPDKLTRDRLFARMGENADFMKTIWILMNITEGNCVSRFYRR